MILDSLTTIRRLLKADSALADYMTSHYTTEPTYAIGKSVPSTAQEYPWVAITLADEARDETRSNRSQRVVIAWFIANSQSVDGVFDGAIECAEIGELILKVLEQLARQQPIGRGYTMRVKWAQDTFTDLSVNFPFYAAETQFTVQLTEP